ncbi:hypothetical protein [Arthrobacter sp. ISL-30]|uniref:hypothetical protein n=1 Tax=Arthrobacter sp. ISL-30 TaxID=2819109 RepID=UPI001BEC140B|nr:hypothetical protein [Arthrobacter sp. ISL-30]MBT2514689.1 hypothetical protein [Arthrobacter sp. ISL-30]
MNDHPEPVTPVHRVRGAARVFFLALVVILASVGVLAVAGGQVNAAKAQAGIAVTLSPSSRTVDQGQSASYTVAATSTGGFSGSVTFAVSGLPAGATGNWSPAAVTLGAGSTAQTTLTVSTATTASAIKSDFTVTGTSGNNRSNTAPGQLHVREVKREFTISGSLSGMLAPGIARPLNLQLSNPNAKTITVSNLSVGLAEVIRTPAAVAANLPCTAADYTISQYSGGYPITLPSGSTSLSLLGVPQAQWPQIRMLDTPLLQDGCKGATLRFIYSGTGQGN